MLLLFKGYEVHGIIWRSSSFNTDQIDHIDQDPHEPDVQARLHYGDLTDGSQLARMIRTHVLSALLRRIHEAKRTGAETVEIWGTGTPRREFLHVDDLADAVIFATKHYTGEEHLDVGVGEDIPIRERAALIADIVGWNGEFTFNTEMPEWDTSEARRREQAEQAGLDRP